MSSERVRMMDPWKFITKDVRRSSREPGRHEQLLFGRIPSRRKGSPVARFDKRSRASASNSLPSRRRFHSGSGIENSGIEKSPCRRLDDGWPTKTNNCKEEGETTLVFTSICLLNCKPSECGDFTCLYLIESQTLHSVSLKHVKIIS